MQEGHRITESKLVGYIQHQYQLKLEELNSEIQLELEKIENDLRSAMQDDLADYTDKLKEQIEKNWQREHADLVVRNRKEIDQLKEMIVTEVLESAIGRVEKELKENTSFAESYYRQHLKLHDPSTVVEVKIDEKYIATLEAVWPDFGGEIRPSDKIGLVITYTDWRTEISPRSLYQTQNDEIRVFLRKFLFG